MPFSLMIVALGLHARTITIDSSVSSKEANRLAARMQGGDTLLLKSGTFHVNLQLNNLHGHLDDPIVIAGERRDGTLINGGCPEPSNVAEAYAISVSHSSWITIENLSIRNSWTDAIRVDESSYITARKLNVKGSRRLVFATGRRSHHFLVENCIWEQDEKVWKKEGDYTWAELHHGKYRCYNGSIFQGRRISGSFIIRNNYIRNVYNGIRLSAMEGVEQDSLACSNGLIYDNVIENSADNAFEPEVYCKNLHFFHNHMVNSHAFISLTEVGGGDLYIYGNTGIKADDCKDGWTIYKISGKERPFTRPVYIFNNSWYVDSTIYGKVRDPYWTNAHVYHFNNAYYISKADTVGVSYLGEDNRFGSDCSNVPFPDRITSRFAWPDLTADPLFVDANHGNFRLQKASPCRNAGLKPFNFPIGTRKDTVDIGAYDDDELIEGPTFRYLDPGPEKPEREKPMIVKSRIGPKDVRLWLSVPIRKESVTASGFGYRQQDGIHLFDSVIVSDGGYQLSLIARQKIAAPYLSIVLRQRPIGLNGEPMTVWGSVIPFRNLTKEDEALNICGRIADRLIADAVIGLRKDTVRYNGGLVRLTRQRPSDRSAIKAKINITVPRSGHYSLGFSYKGRLRLQMYYMDVLNETSRGPECIEYAYERYRFAHRLNIYLQEGINTLSATYEPDRENIPFLCAFLQPDEHIDSVPKIGNGHYDSDWLLQTARSHGQPMFQPPYIGTYIKTNSDNKRLFSFDWNYANGITLYGLINLARLSGNGSQRLFIDRYLNAQAESLDCAAMQYFRDHFVRGAFYKYFRSAMLDDTGGPGLAYAAYAATHSSDSKKQSIICHCLQQVMHSQSRLSDGTFCRHEPSEGAVWADDAFMSLPFLAIMGALKKNDTLSCETIKGIIRFDRCLYDSSKGVYRHGSLDNGRQQTPVAWGRANGWMFWAIATALSETPERTEGYDAAKRIFIDRLKGILHHQDTKGMFHQIINDPTSYPEVSATSMIAIALCTALRHNWLPASYRHQLESAWTAVCQYIGSDGSVDGICGSTDLNEEPAYYRQRKTLLNDPRGLGAILTLGADMATYFHSLNR